MSDETGIPGGIPAVASALILAFAEGASHVPLAPPPAQPDPIVPFALLAAQCAQFGALAEAVADAWLDVIEYQPRSMLRIGAIERSGLQGAAALQALADFDADSTAWEQGLEAIKAGLSERGQVMVVLRDRIEDAARALVAHDGEFLRRARKRIIKESTADARAAAAETGRPDAAETAAAADAGAALKRRGADVPGPSGDTARAALAQATAKLAEDARSARTRIDPVDIRARAVALWNGVRDGANRQLDHMRALIRAEMGTMRLQAMLQQLQCDGHAWTAEARAILVTSGARAGDQPEFAWGLSRGAHAVAAGGGAGAGHAAAIKSCGHAEALAKDAAAALAAVGGLQG